MYQPASLFRRTDAERADQMLSWERADRAFFAAGACHVLAWAFMQQFPDQGFGVAALRKVGEPHAFHVYASDGIWAFDFEGFTPECELLAVTEAVEAGSGSIQRLIVTAGLETFCAEHQHRNPADYPYVPWDRARTYITQFTWPPTLRLSERSMLPNASYKTR